MGPLCSCAGCFSAPLSSSLRWATAPLLLRLLAPSDGFATVLGYDAFRETEQVRARARYMSQKFALYDDLTVWENIEFYGGVYGVRDRARLDETLARVELTEHHHEMAGSLSAGWRQRLALSIALVHQPKLLFLDEPTSGVDPNARRVFWDLIYDLAADGTTVFVTTHYMDEAEYCERVGIMRAGKLLALDKPNVLKETTLAGPVWDVYALPLEDALDALVGTELVLRAGLAGNHLRVITKERTKEKDLRKILEQAGLRPTLIERGEATLEDVFLSLAKE